MPRKIRDLLKDLRAAGFVALQVDEIGTLETARERLVEIIELSK